MLISRRKLLRGIGGVGALPLIPRPSLAQSLSLRNPLAFPVGMVPGLNRMHPAAQNNGLTAINLGGGSFINLSGVGNSPLGTVVGTPSEGVQALIGPSMNFPGVSDQIRFAGMPTTSQDAMTAAAICMFTAVSGTQNQFLVGCDSNAAGGLLLGVNVGSVNFGVNYATPSFYNSSIPVIVNVPVFVAASVTPTTVALVVCQLDNGKIFSETGVIAGVSGVGDGTWTISGRAGATGRQAIGYVAAAMASYTTLSLQQLLQWAADPWDFWYPQQDFSLVGLSASAARLRSLIGVGK